MHELYTRVCCSNVIRTIYESYTVSLISIFKSYYQLVYDIYNTSLNHFY